MLKFTVNAWQQESNPYKWKLLCLIMHAISQLQSLPPSPLTSWGGGVNGDEACPLLHLASGTVWKETLGWNLMSLWSPAGFEGESLPLAGEDLTKGLVHRGSWTSTPSQRKKEKESRFISTHLYHDLKLTVEIITLHLWRLVGHVSSTQGCSWSGKKNHHLTKCFGVGQGVKE